MTSDEKIIYDAILTIKARKESLRIVPSYSLLVELGRVLKDFSRGRIEKSIRSLEESGEIVVGNTLNDKYLKITREFNEDEVMEHFEIIIKSFLEEKAKTDPRLAERLKIESKTMEECCNYILQEVHKKATGQWTACTDEEVFGMAVHYWDEDNIKVEKQTGCKVVTNRKLTNEEMKEAEALGKQKKGQRAQKIKEQQETDKARDEEAKKKKKAEEDKVKRKKQEEESSLFLFSDEDFI